MIETSESLLARLKKGEAGDAWEDFYRLYWPAIVSYGRRLGLDDAEARDVLQETMLALMQLLPRFRYDRAKGRFRNYLFTLVHHRALTRLRRTARRGRPEMAAHAADELYGHRDGEPDRAAREAWQASLLTAALRQLEKDSRIQGDTFAIFKACVIHGDSHAAVAARFKVEENYVYQVKHRLTRRLQAEVRRLAELSGFDGAV